MGIHMDSPGVVDHACAFGNLVPHVLVIPYNSMWNTENSCRHPPQALLHAAADILGLWVVHVVHAWVSVPTDSINRSLCFSLSIRVQNHSLTEPGYGRGGRVGTGFQCRTRRHSHQ